MNLDKKVLDKIERENIRMIPGWFFVLKNVFLNACWVIAFLGSAVSFAMLLEWSNADAKLATFWSIGFILLSFISFKSAWRINFKALYKYGFAAMIAFLSFGSAMGFAIYSSKETGNIEIYMEKIPVYKSISPEEVKEFNSEEILENQNVEIKDGSTDLGIDRNETDTNPDITKEADDEKSGEIENKKLLKVEDDGKELEDDDERTTERKVMDQKEDGEDEDNDDGEDLIETEPQVKGMEKERESSAGENEVKSDEDESFKSDTGDANDEEE
jgi:hypothetical protein